MIEHLPADWREALLLGRLRTHAGPTRIVVSRGRVLDVSRATRPSRSFSCVTSLDYPQATQRAEFTREPF